MFSEAINEVILIVNGVSVKGKQNESDEFFLSLASEANISFQTNIHYHESRVVKF